MTRAELLKSIIDWWVLDISVRTVEWPIARDRLTTDVDTLLDQWLQKANPEWFPIALDVANHPPDLRNSIEIEFAPGWDAEEHFLMMMTSLLARWYPYCQSVWFREMTPMLNNEVERADNARYCSAREMALTAARLAITFSPEHLTGQLFDWVEPTSIEWNDFNEEEKTAFLRFLLRLERLTTPPDLVHRIRFKISQLSQSIEAPYSNWLVEETN